MTAATRCSEHNAVSVRQAVITGVGLVTPIGGSLEEFWDSCIQGRCGVRLISSFDASQLPCRIAGEVKDFAPRQWLSPSDMHRMPRFVQMAVVAAVDAFACARLDPVSVSRERIAIVVGNGSGGMANLADHVLKLVGEGWSAIEPLMLLKVLPDMAVSHLCSYLGIKGHGETCVAACASSTVAIGRALDLIRTGRADVVLAGGTEAWIQALGIASFAALKALSTRNDDPSRASRPFDALRDGFVPAEGAAMLVVEEMSHAIRRGAPLLAELAGFASTNDAYNLVAPDPRGDGAALCMREAMDDAGVSPEEVDYINAHGTSTPRNDIAETRAIKAIFGRRAYEIPVSSTKSLIGHAMGAAGAIETVACIQAIRTGWLHPTINQEKRDPKCDLDFVPNIARRQPVNVILKNSFAFGGQNACLVLKAGPRVEIHGHHG